MPGYAAVATDGFDAVIQEIQRRFSHGSGETAWCGCRVYSQVLKELREEAVAASQREKRGERERVIVFDWDDTILATTALRSISSYEGEKMTVDTEVVDNQLKVLDPVALKLFQTAATVGQVVIVTNSSGGWVEESSEKFLPRLSEHLVASGIRIISARDLYSQLSPEKPSEWKAAAIQELLGGAPGRELNVTVLGDCYSDQCAAHAVQKALSETSEVSMKFVKLATKPSILRLVRELMLLNLSLERIAKCRSSFDICISV